MRTIRFKKILITGGTGSIGRALTKRLLETNVEEIRIYSRDEWKHFEFGQEFRDERIIMSAGDVRDRARLSLAMRGVDAVFHLASMRHIDMCDRYASESASISIDGTRNVVDLCLELGIPKAVFTSSAEAVYPTNVYGCGKYIGERIFYQAFA